MLALIKKDFNIFGIGVYIFLTLFILAIVITSLPATFAMIIGVLTVAFSTFMYDEKNKTNVSMVSLPVSIGTLIVSRYMYSLLVLIAILIVEWIGSTINISPDFEAYQIQDFLMFFAVGLIMIAICYPILYFFQKSYQAITVIFILISVGTFFTIDASVNIMNMTDEIIFNRLDKGMALLANKYIPFQPYLVTVVLAAALFVGSIRLSVLIFKKKDG